MYIKLKYFCQGTSSKGSNPYFANNVDIRVPNLYPGTYECKKNDFEKEINVEFKNECNWTNAYAGFITRNVILEERNCKIIIVTISCCNFLHYFLFKVIVVHIMFYC